MKKCLFHSLPFLSSLLLWAAFFPLDLGLLGWVALVPLIVYAIRSKKGWVLFLVAWAAGWVFNALAFQWIRHSAPIGPYAVAVYMGIYFALFALLVRVLSRRLPLLLVAPLTWIALEFTSAWFLTGLPWFLLAYTQHEILPFIQCADLLGPWGVSGIVLFGNVVVAKGILLRLEKKVIMRQAGFRRGLAFLAILVTATALYGKIRLAGELEEGPRIGVVQPNIKQDLKLLSEAPFQASAIYTKHRDMTVALVEKERDLDLVIWPESVIYQGLVYDVHLDSYNPDWSRLSDMTQFVTVLGCPVIFGTEVIERKEASFADTESTNSAVLVEPGKGFSYRFDKVHLVVFSERIPELPFVEYFTEKYTGAKRLLNFKPGTDYPLFEVAGTPAGTMICFETVFPEISRKIAGKGAKFIVNISNEGWFKKSAELDQMLVMSRFRAIESRIGIVRGTNTGISAFVDPHGNVTDMIEGKEVEGTMAARVRVSRNGSLYRSVGDLLAWFASLFVLASLAWMFVRKRLTGNFAASIVTR
jgi:apolipoprotein N-acyltransferase